MRPDGRDGSPGRVASLQMVAVAAGRGAEPERGADGVTRASRARRLVTGAMYGGGGLGLAGAGLVAVLRGEARSARRRVEARVARGDSLGKISRKFDCDMKQLAKANGLKAPGYSVRPGQEIKLQGCKK